MSKQDLIIKIDGSIHFDNYHENRINNRELIINLNGARNEILEEIHYQIAKELTNEIEIDLHFNQGSILVTGVAIIKWISITGGVFSFIDYASRIVKHVVSRVIENWLRKNGQIQQKPYIIISTTSNSGDFQHIKSNSQNNISSELFSQRTILIAITVINIVLFLGGNIYNFFTVQSTKDQYLKSKEELIDLNSDLKMLFTEIELSQLKAKSALENLPDKMEKEYTLPLSAKRDSLMIDARILKTNLYELQYDINKLNEFYNDSTLTITKLLSENKNKKNIKIGVEDLNWIIITLSFLSLLNLVFIIALFRRQQS